MADGKYRYSVFMSYAHADDIAWADWITYFDKELNRGLQALLGEIKPPGTHLSSKNGPIHGPLNAALKSAIEDSYAMIVFVHNNYLRSRWCLQELQHFRDLHGLRGFRERLFIVAMSKGAIESLSERPEWRELFPEPDPVWMPFHQLTDDAHNEPIFMFLKRSYGNEAVAATDFLQPFFRLRKKLVESIQNAFDWDPDLFKSVPQTRRALGKPDEVLLYIESEPGQEDYWEPLGLQVEQAWKQVWAKEASEPPLLLRPTGLPMHDLRNRPRLDDADAVILLWGEKTRESLLAQIELVEPKLKAPNLAPGLIAYLVEAGADPMPEVPRLIRSWPVVQFATRHSDPATAVVVDDDEARLRKYLREVLMQKRQSQGQLG